MTELLLPRNSTQYVVPGTDTFRLASRMLTIELTRPKRDGQVGSNLQNIEGSMRAMYYADKGMKLLQRDQAGAEALIVAYLCKPGNFRNLFLNRVKPHVFVGLHVFKEVWKKEFKDEGIETRPDIDFLCSLSIPELQKYQHWKAVDKRIRDSDNWPAERRYYYIAKQICHSSNYGVKAGMFQLNTLEKSKGRIVISKRDAEYYLEVYHSLFPEIHEWHREIEKQINATRTLYNLFGYPRYFWFPNEYVTEQQLKSMFAFIPQSTVGTITNIAITKMQNYIESERLPWDVWQNNHDSMAVQFPDSEEHEKECIRKSKEFIECDLMSPRGEPFKMKSEVGTGYNWGKYKKDKNEDGLKEYNE